ncbi:HAD hydrolase-like protein [uncultured Jatrophihabitans sp.]|uniref:HAD hydrolase-like protein n=1 Tax=uncultured Jatrophihabitans sp. TaxID=1610747 RepID=UPI0035C99DD0
MLSYVLFDLDGTLSDSAPGILTSLRHAFAENGVPPLDADTERTLLGPPFYTSLPPYLPEGVELWDVINSYRAHYRAGAMYNTTAYAGIGDALDAVRAAGLTMAVATSKPEAQAVPIVERLGFADHFVTVGGDLDYGSRGTKALVVQEVLRRLGDPAPDTVLMVGDREHDVLGARACGVETIGAGWGYGGPGELEAAGARAICAAPRELPAALGIEAIGSLGAAAS